jgi:propanol-preferring alcohol dehydrogenase
MTMRAMRLTEPRSILDLPLSPGAIPKPVPSTGELLLRVQACAVCRTDLQLVEGDLAARHLPIVPGHQVVGLVESVGEDVSGWRQGEAAGVAWLASACGVCEFCLSGRENLCMNAQFTGWDRDGGYADYVTVRADFALHLPSGFAPAEAAPLLCGGIIGYRALKRSGIQAGRRLGLFGYGASAHLALQVALHWGSEVFVFTRSESEQRRALDTGAMWAGSYDASPGVLLDAAVTFAPVGEVVLAALESIDRGGVVAINAIHLDKMPEFPYELLWWERELRSVANFTRQDATEFLELAGDIPIRTATQIFPLLAANRALGLLKSGDLEGTAVLIPE